MDTRVVGQVCQLKPSNHEEPPAASRRVETTVAQHDDFFSDMREEIVDRPQNAASVDISYDENMLRFYVAGTRRIQDNVTNIWGF